MLRDLRLARLLFDALWARAHLLILCARPQSERYRGSRGAAAVKPLAYLRFAERFIDGNGSVRVWNSGIPVHQL